MEENKETKENVEKKEIKANKEKKEKKQKTEDNTHQKAGWMIGFALIIFLILLLGAVVGMKLVRDGTSEFSQKVDRILSGNDANVGVHYTVWEDGTKENNSKGVVEAEIDIDNVRFSHFRVVEYHYEDGIDSTTQETEITAVVENMNEDAIAGAKDYTIQLLGDQGDVLTEYTMHVENLPAREPVPITHYIRMIDCVNAATVVVK